MKNKIKYRKEALITIQKNVRMWLCKRKYKPRIRTLVKVKALQSQLTAMEHLVTQLKNDKEKSSQQVKSLKQQLAATITKIKVRVLH